MKNYWVSFWVGPQHGGFELHSPWWISGYRFVDGKMPDDDEDEVTESSVCAGIKAESEEAAQEIVYASFDTRPASLDFRFVEERPDDWSPFSGRFPKADWMTW